MDDAFAVSRMRNVVKSMMWRRARTEALTLPFHVHPRHIIRGRLQLQRGQECHQVRRLPSGCG